MKRCLVCGSEKVIEVVKISDMPVFCNVLLPSKDKALNAVKGDLDMCFCNQCGHIFNKAFRSDILEYSEDYDNTLHYSPKFQAFAEKLVNSLITKYNITGKDVIDIGCGKGD